MEILHSKIMGSGNPFLILHGFLGMSDNWKTLGRKFSNNFEVHLIDQRNHGRSFHNDEFSYELMAEDLDRYIRHYDLKNSILLGHSMGGKTSMLYATKYPEKVTKLIIADIAPKEYPAHHQYILKALDQIDFSKHFERKEIEIILKKYISAIGIVLFLMKNIYRQEKNKLGYRFNLKILKNKYDEVVKSNNHSANFSKPALFLKGEKSNYIEQSDYLQIKTLFPNASIEIIKDAGHWLHAENPEEFYQKIIQFT